MATNERLLQVGEFARIVNGLLHEEMLFELADAHSQKSVVALFSTRGEFVEFADLDNPRNLTPDELALLVSTRSFGIIFHNYRLTDHKVNDEALRDENGKDFNAITRLSLGARRDDTEAMRSLFKLAGLNDRKRLTVGELTNKITDQRELANSSVQSEGIIQSVIVPLIAEEGREWVVEHSGSKVMVRYANSKIKPHFDRFGLELTNIGFQVQVGGLKRLFKGLSG